MWTRNLWLGPPGGGGCLAMSIGSLCKGFVGLSHVKLFLTDLLNICCSTQPCSFNAHVSYFFFLTVGAVVLTDTLCDFDVINSRSKLDIHSHPYNQHKWTGEMCSCTMWQGFHTPRITSWKRIEVVDIQLILFLGLELCGQELLVSASDSLTVFTVSRSVWILQASGDVIIVTNYSFG